MEIVEIVAAVIGILAVAVLFLLAITQNRAALHRPIIINKRPITEKDKALINEWYKEAGGMTMEGLDSFLYRLTEAYVHSYGTICHALTAGAIATMYAMDKTPQGGITGFQAGIITWDFIRRWKGWEDEPLKLTRYNDMLYPQYAREFQQTISPYTWEWLQRKARELMSERSQAHPDTANAHHQVFSHWQSIADGQVPFGYTVRKED
ncbi:MAG: hypothetical protein KAR06_08035 [Deltaproteobacteria bacterium]|nr:hypothetical protein [Deltaproteobacteria bacterium]